MTWKKIILIWLVIAGAVSVARAQKAGFKKDWLQVYVAPNKIFGISPSFVYKSYSNHIGLGGGLQLNVNEHLAFRLHYDRYNYRPSNDPNQKDKLVMNSFMADLMFPGNVHPSGNQNGSGISLYSVAGAGAVEQLTTTSINTISAGTNTTSKIKFGLELGLGFSETIYRNLSLFEDIRWVNIFTGKKHTNLFPVQIGIKI